MADDIYTLKVDGDITALSDTIKQTMQQLSAGMNDAQAEQLRNAAIIEREKLTGINKLTQIELKAAKDVELERIRAAHRVSLAQQRAALRGGVGGAGNTADRGFMTSLLGAENATAAVSTKIRIVSAEFLKLATFSRTATLALNAFKGASSGLVGAGVGVAVLAIAGGLKYLGDKFMSARREAVKLREEQEKLNAELRKTAVILGTPKGFLGAVSGLDDNQKMLEEMARKGFVGLPGLTKAGEKYGNADKTTMASMMILDGYSEDTAKAFTTLWQVTKGRFEEMSATAKQASIPHTSWWQSVKNSYGQVKNISGQFAALNALGFGTYAYATNKQNKIQAEALKKQADLSESLSAGKYFNLEALTKAGEEFRAATKEAAKKVKEVKNVALEFLVSEFTKAFNKQADKSKDFNKWLDEKNSLSKNRAGVDNPADSFYAINKGMTDYAIAYKAEKDEIVKRLDKLVEGDTEMYALWQQMQSL